MKNTTALLAILLAFSLIGCKQEPSAPAIALEQKQEPPFIWEAANMYFLMTDRFYNADPSNDVNFDRTKETAVLRGFEGGDIKGITQKIESGYFNDLGVNAIWFTPVVEQNHSGVDEGTGYTYGFHGYWAKDWTKLDPNFGTMEELKKLVDTAHENGIRVVMDVVLNHTGHPSEKDPFWGEDWARKGPNCGFTTYENTTKCNLVTNLSDIKTESDKEVELPPHLIEKWKSEGRYEQEIKELDAFFKESGLARTPRNYIIKWLTDYVRAFGIDAFRVDTTKHVEEDAWVVLRAEADRAFEDYKTNHPDGLIDDNDFFMFGEVYNYMAGQGREFDLGDKKVDYFDHGFDNLINFQFKYDAQNDYETLFARYDSIIHGPLEGKSIVNYATSHDDGNPFDKDRTRSMETATKLLLTPGISQIYYGDESARDLTIEGTNGDATLRSPMNWDELDQPKTKAVLNHWQKLGQFRDKHPAIGAGKHQMLSKTPYVFSRRLTYDQGLDMVVVGLDLPKGEKTIEVGSAFAKAVKANTDDLMVTDAYSGQRLKLSDGKVTIDSPFSIVLLEY